MIGHMEFEVNNIQQQGIRMSADVLVRHAWSNTEGNEHVYPLTITTELLESWGFKPPQAENAIKELLTALYDGVVGFLAVSSNPPPEHGYWFDTHNSKPSIRETVAVFINAQDHLPFLSNPADKHRISGIFGGAILCELERADALAFQHKGQRLLGDLDTSFDRSRAVHDLSTQPDDEKDLGHKINLLATIIDKFNIRKSDEAKGVKSIKALENWLAGIVGDQKAREITQPFARIRDLRNQYPVHDQYEKTRQPRPAVAAAETYFGFRDIDDAAAKWKKVCDAFRGGVQEVLQAIG
jgi:hypothetical protein